MPPLETRYYRIERLLKWEHIEEVNDMLINGVSPITVSSWCKERGFSISSGKMYDYKEMLMQAVTKQITVERMLGIGMPKRSAIVLQALGLAQAKDMVKTEMEVLDGIIQRGFTSLLARPGDIKIADAMKAIELKNKLTQGAHGGFTNYGLDQLRELEQAKFQAMVEVVMKYVPDDKFEELQQAIASAERKYYEEKAPELLEQYEKSMQEELDDENEYTEKHLAQAVTNVNAQLDGKDPEQIIVTDF